MQTTITAPGILTLRAITFEDGTTGVSYSVKWTESGREAMVRVALANGSHEAEVEARGILAEMMRNRGVEVEWVDHLF